jgi:hypothetical protein
MNECFSTRRRISRLLFAGALVAAPGFARAQGIDVSLEAVGGLSHLPAGLNTGNAIGGGLRLGVQASHRLMLEAEHTTAEVSLQPVQFAGGFSFNGVSHSELAVRAMYVIPLESVDVVIGAGPAYNYFRSLHISPHDAAGLNASLGLRYSPTTYSLIRLDGGLTHMFARNGQPSGFVPSIRIGVGLRLCVLPRLEEE